MHQDRTDPHRQLKTNVECLIASCRNTGMGIGGSTIALRVSHGCFFSMEEFDAFVNHGGSRLKVFMLMGVDGHYRKVPRPKARPRPMPPPPPYTAGGGGGGGGDCCDDCCTVM